VPLTMVLVMPLDRVPLWITICFFGAIDARESLFKVFEIRVRWENDLASKLKVSLKALICGE